MSELRPLRVLHIMGQYGGGISMFIKNLAMVAPDQNIVFDIATYTECPEDFVQLIRETGGDVYELKNPKKAGWRNFSKSLSQVMSIYDYDAVHCHIAGYRVPAYWLPARHYGIDKFYIHAHYSYGENNSNIFSQLLISLNQKINRDLTSAYLGSSQQAVWSLFGQVPYKDMVVFPNALQVDRFLFSKETAAKLRRLGRQRYQLGDEEFIIGQIGRLTPVKNHALSLDLARYIKANGLAARIVLAGQGELEGPIKQAINDEDLYDQIKLLGRVEPIETFYPVLDALLFPSFHEGFGNVALEAQTAGLPVVMSESLPKEVDLDLGLVQRLDLDAPINNWYQALWNSRQIEIPSQDQRLRALEDRALTNTQAIVLYRQLLEGGLDSHHIYKR